VKFLGRSGLQGKKYDQFTAIDDCTRFRVLRIYDHNTVKSAVVFINQVKHALPFAIKQVQTDNGSECSDTFSWHLEDLGIHHRKTKLRSPEENGKVERSHRTDEEALYGVNRFMSIHHFTKLLAQWEKEYNGHRPHMALGGKTPRAFLTEKLKTHYSKQMLTVPVKPVQDVG
jgi:transposase InsO family protein